MNRKLIEFIIGVGLFLILLTFNPFTSPGVYFDSTSSFTFTALHKVTLLAVLNIVLLIFWVVRTIKTKELSITSSKLYLPIFLFVASSLLSTLFSINKTNSLLGFNSTLGNSFVETSMLAIFFFIFVNNVRDSEGVQNILRYFNISIAVTVLWTLFRYAGTWSNGSIFFRDYVNSVFFTPTGHYSSLVAITLTSLILSIGLTVNSIIQNKSRNILVIDSLVLLVIGTGFFNFLNIAGSSKPYFYLAAGLLSFTFIGYLLCTNRRLKPAFVPVLSLVLLSLVLGLGSYFGITHRKVQPLSYPSMPLNVSWNISLDSIKSSISKGLLGIGQGNFAYGFDRFKSDSLVAGNLTINNNAPSVPEIRINHAGSYFLETLSAQGLFGLLALIAIFAMFVLTGAKKVFTEMPTMGAFGLLAFVVLGVSTVITGYDFSLLLTFWLLLGVLMVFYHENEPQKNLNIALAGRSFDTNHNLNYILPLILIALTSVVVYNGAKITDANVSVFWAKRFQSIGNLERYQNSSLDAVNKYPESDVMIRELANANGAILINQLDTLQKKVTDDPASKDSQDVIDQANSLSSFQKGILNNLAFAMSKYPDEYKNYYLAGLLTSRISEYANLAQDQSALQYLSTSISLNPYHPDTYFQLAKLMERNKDYNTAFNNIQLANTYDTNNLFYQVKYADIFVEVQGYDQALKIYDVFKDYSDKNASNTQIQDFYKTQDIDAKIANVKKLIAERDAKAAEEKKAADSKNSPIETPTPSPTKKPVK